MACAADDTSADDPIVLPLLRNDPSNLALHDQIYLDMQNCLLEPMKSQVHDIRGNVSNQPIWSPARDVDQDSNRPRDWHNIMSDPGSSVDAYRSLDTDRNTINPHGLTSAPYEATNNNATGTATSFIPMHYDGKNNNMSAMERLASHSRKLYDENAKHDMHMDENSSECRDGEWSAYPGTSDFKSSFNYYGVQVRSYDSDNSTDKSCDMYDDPDQ